MNYFSVTIEYSKLNKPEQFLTSNNHLKIGEYVVIASKRGKEIGIVVSNPLLITRNINKFKNFILHKASEEDLNNYHKNKEKTDKIFNFVKKQNTDLNLKIKFLFAELIPNKNKIVISYFSKKKCNYEYLLPQKYLDTNIEFYQINNQHRVSTIGNIGVCGRKLCCTTFLQKIKNISFDKVKNQNLSLNINKLTGPCCKLKCCIDFENDIYTQENKKFPKINSTIKFNQKKYKVLSFNVINQLVKCSNKKETICIPLKKIINENKN